MDRPKHLKLWGIKQAIKNILKIPMSIFRLIEYVIYCLGRLKESEKLWISGYLLLIISTIMSIVGMRYFGVNVYTLFIIGLMLFLSLVFILASNHVRNVE